MLSTTAPAKLNLYLYITGKRADGYHLLESLVVFTDLADEIHVAESKTLSLTVEGAFADASGATEDNLVLRAARLLQAHTGTAHGAAITLTKNIPVGAGLGGGSADAAAALRALNVFWKLNLTDEILFALAPRLGADVAMCLVSKPLIARGIGEIIEPLTQTVPELYAVLVYPGVKLLSGEVYGALRYTNPSPKILSLASLLMERLSEGAGEGFLDTIATYTRNDLQPAAVSLAPAVDTLLKSMASTHPTPALVRMTGSGSCCFALFEEASAAEAYQKAISAQYPAFFVRRVKMLMKY